MEKELLLSPQEHGHFPCSLFQPDHTHYFLEFVASDNENRRQSLPPHSRKGVARLGDGATWPATQTWMLAHRFEEGFGAEDET